METSKEQEAQRKSHGIRCSFKFCKQSAKRACGEIDDDDTRKELFHGFWQLINWCKKNPYISTLVDVTPKAYQRKREHEKALHYHLKVNGTKNKCAKRCF